MSEELTYSRFALRYRIHCNQAKPELAGVQIRKILFTKISDIEIKFTLGLHNSSVCSVLDLMK